MGTTHLGLEPGALTHGWRDKPEGFLAQQYVKHNDYVKKHVPPKQLLVFNVKEGWKPLCDFLGCDVPEGDFPHSKVNDTKALLQLKKMFLGVVYGFPTMVVLGAAGALYLSLGQKRSTRAR